MNDLPGNIEFAKFIENRNCLVKFGAEWCAPCRLIAPLLEKVAKDTGVDIFEVDIDNNIDLSTQFGIRSVPTIIAFKDGKAVDIVVGTMSEANYKELAERIIK